MLNGIKINANIKGYIYILHIEHTTLLGLGLGLGVPWRDITRPLIKPRRDSGGAKTADAASDWLSAMCCVQISALLPLGSEESDVSI